MQNNPYKKKFDKLATKYTALKLHTSNLENILYNSIFPAKTFILWQLYNKVKKRVLYILGLVIRLPFSLLYFLFGSIFFLASKFVDYIIFFNKTPLKVELKYTELDGVSFIIPSWNNREMLIRCITLLDSYLVKEESTIRKEIVVIVNGSTDGTLEILPKLNIATRLIIVNQNINIGFARAINIGITYSNFNYIYLLNDDMEVRENFFVPLVQYAKKLIINECPFFGIASQIFFKNPRQRREESGKNYIKPSFGFINISHYIQKDVLINESITLYPGGGSSLLNKKVFQKLGMYDYKSYAPLYCEDLDLGFIGWKLGFPSYFCPNSHVVHYHRTSSTKLNKEPSFFMHKNWLVFILKNFNTCKTIIPHLFFYSFKILLSRQYLIYAIYAIKNLPNIFFAKIKLYRFSILNSDSKLINFPLFEIKLNE